jgi:hypothetical protein
MFSLLRPLLIVSRIQEQDEIPAPVYCACSLKVSLWTKS